ncbi:MAG: glycosyltransferase [Ruminococcus sp.]
MLRAGETAEAGKHYIYRACGHCKIYGETDFITLTSISEGQPLSVLESFAARRPCVTTDVGCCRELLEGKEEDVYGKAGYYVAPMYRGRTGSCHGENV